MRILTRAAERDLERVAELEQRFRSRPELDQALAALRELGEAVLSFQRMPVWKPWLWSRRYRAMQMASRRLKHEMDRFS